MTSEDLLATLREMKPKSHLLLFYDSIELKHRILYEYVADGLNNGRGIVYVCSDETPKEIRKGLSEKIDVEPNEKSGNLMIKYYDEWYFDNGKVETPRIMKKWSKVQDAFEKKGLETRAIGEVSCFYKKGKVKELLQYEYTFKKNQPQRMEAICAYDIRTVVSTGYTDTIMPLVRAHGKALFVSKNESVVLEPEDVEEADLEKLLSIKV